MHFLKKRTLHCALYSLLHFSKHKLTWTLNLNTLSFIILWCKYNDIVNKIFVGMFACSRLKLIMNIIFCSYLKPKRGYIGFANLQFRSRVPEYHCNHRAFSRMDGCWFKQGEWNHQRSWAWPIRSLSRFDTPTEY